jgi:hypothetical protein
VEREKMVSFPSPPHNTRIGYHYFPDSLHYRENHLAAWLPELRALGASWVTLAAPLDRAIPEGFLRGLLAAGIEPVLHFPLSPGAPSASGVQAGATQDLRLLFETYAQWGVHYVVLFDRPNARASWPAQAWARNNLVERFLDLFLPLAEAASQMGLFPVFPPLEPGGDYWDTAFLRQALQGLQRRSRPGLLERLVLGAYAWVGHRPLNWGAGGPERWPAARPYDTPANSEDQRGFHIFDWYQTLSRAALHESCPVLIVAGGSRMADGHGGLQQAVRHTRINLAIASLMEPASKPSYDPINGALLEPVPEKVLACNFWLLAASPTCPSHPDAWFQANGYSLPVVGALKQQLASSAQDSARQLEMDGLQSSPPPASQLVSGSSHPESIPSNGKPIAHYLLLPRYEWGVSDWHLDVIRPFVKKYQPTVGFSMDEAMHARRVTVVGGSDTFSTEQLERLHSAGCSLDVIDGNGTNIATLLAMM